MRPAAGGLRDADESVSVLAGAAARPASAFAALGSLEEE